MLTLSFNSVAFNGINNQNATSISDDIAQIFPSATRVGPVDKDIPVTPVYQLNELLGYVFESDDFTHFIAFSGQTVNLLIGIDTQGILTGLKILNHHEPIFLHGLGEQPLFRFIKQYEGHSIKDRVIINARDKATLNTSYFDGITRATISVLVINDTIIASALKVAREKLTGFLAPSNITIDPDVYQDLNFEALEHNNYLNHWQLTSEQAIAQTDKSPALVREINNVIENNISVEHSNYENTFIDLYFAFVNIPIIGKNLLGEQEYQRLLNSLKPGEHALMVFNRGNYSFISENFIPQTVPSRLSAVQSGLPVDIRDIDFYSYYDPSFALTLPSFNDVKVFRIKSQSGFELNKPFSLALSVSYNQSFLSQQQHNFTIETSLPNTLFIQQQPKKDLVDHTPLWLKIWQSRSIEILILAIYLGFLTVLFVKQYTFAKNTNAMRQVRLFSLFFVIAFIGYYAQGQLSVVNIYTLLLSLKQGFKIEVFLLDPVIFILWVFVFITLFIWGRGVFCGWLCPFGALQELVTLIASKLKIRQFTIKPKHHNIARKIKYLALFLLIGISFYSLTLAEKLAEIEPFKTSITLNFIRYWPFVLYVVLLLALSLKIHKFYCRYLCPLGAGIAIVGRYPLLKKLWRRQECGSPCQLCRTKKCGIDAINIDGSIDYNECIQCLECLVTIESPQLCVVSKYSNKKNRYQTKSDHQNLSSLPIKVMN